MTFLKEILFAQVSNNLKINRYSDVLNVVLVEKHFIKIIDRFPDLHTRNYIENNPG